MSLRSMARRDESRWGNWPGYAMAIGGVALAAWLRWVLARWLGPDIPPYITFYPAVILSAIFGGTTAGLLATGLSMLMVAHLFLHPSNSIIVERPVDIAALVIFGVVNIMMSVVGGALRNARRRKNREARELVMTVQLLDLANVSVRDNEDRIIRWNTGCQRLYGFTAAEALGKVSHQLLRTHFPEPLQNIQKKLRSTGRWAGELVHTAKDGRAITVASEWLLQADENGQPFAVTEVNTDLTERRAAEAASAMMAAIIADSNDAIIAKDLSGRITSWNRGAERVFGYRAEEVLEKNIRLLIPPERQDEEDRILSTIRRGEKIEHSESQRLARNGRRIEVSVTTSPIRNASGQIIGASTIARDITARKQAERRLNVFFESGMVGNIYWSTDGRILDANTKFLQMIGYTRQELHAGGVHWDDMTPPEYRHLDERALEELRTTGIDTPYEKEFIRKDGTRIWVLIGAAMLDSKSQEGVAFVLDISQRKHAEAQVRRRSRISESTSRLYREALSCQTEQELGWVCLRVATDLTQSTGGFLAKINASGQLEDIAITDAVLGPCSREPGHSAFRLVPGGAEAHGLYARVLLDCKGFFTNEPSSHPDRAGLPEGHPQLFSFLAVPLIHADAPSGVIALSNRPGGYSQEQLEDLSALALAVTQVIERFEVEQALRHAQEELARANQDLEQQVQQRTLKLRETVADLQHFSYAITHDMRAPLRAMQSFAAILEEEQSVRAKPETLDYCRRIRAAAGRLDKLIQDSLDYAKVLREELPRAPVDVAKLLREIIGGYPNLQRYAPNITVEFDKLVLIGNQAGLTQCFSNLLDNAIKFVAPGVTPCVRIWAEQREGRVRIWVGDNGLGISPDQGGKIFDMFQRLHDERAYPGTGIGLAIVQKAVQRMGGTVGFESEAGKGSRFWLELESAEEHEARAVSGEIVKDK